MKKALSERDICTKFITPAVKQAGWDVLSQIREEVFFTKGRIIVRGKLVTRGKTKFADYVLFEENAAEEFCQPRRFDRRGEAHSEPSSRSRAESAR